GPARRLQIVIPNRLALYPIIEFPSPFNCLVPCFVSIEHVRKVYRFKLVGNRYASNKGCQETRISHVVEIYSVHVLLRSLDRLEIRVGRSFFVDCENLALFRVSGAATWLWRR